MTTSYEPLPIEPLSLLLSCQTYICHHLDKIGSLNALPKEVKDELRRFAITEHLVNDMTLELFLPSNADAKEIDLEGCDRITDHSIMTVTRKYPSLTSLNLAWCQYVSPSAVTKALQSSPHIIQLNLSYMTNFDDQSLVNISNLYPQLRHLSLQGCTAITDAGLIKLVTKCTEITYLNISHIKSLTSASLKAIVSSLPKLATLDVSWGSPEAFSDGTMQKLGKAGQKLQHLAVADSLKVTESALTKLVQQLPALTSLDVSYCKELVVSSPEKFAKSMPPLLRFLAPGVPLSEAAILKLLETLPELQELNISSNDQLRPTLIQALVNNPGIGKGLQILTLGASKHIPALLVLSLIEARPTLSVTFYALAN
eukprot:TRINITY_DN14858_c0_g1_i1.p1 TRINITY_DN14858_c0_g1~~TRINITY_DN14858_c0_g1_i1.p1  ORF type:complete len:383 (-),score=67.93 TRINITY_DN14858_c0_g1_i1:128-1234(-)